VAIGGLVHVGALPWTGATRVTIAPTTVPMPSTDPPAAGGPRRLPEPSTGGPRTAAAGPVDQATGQTQPPPLRSRTAVTERPRAVIQVLTDVRVQALTTRDAARLVDVHVKGSPSWEVDARVILELLAGRQRYERLSMTVDGASHVSGGPTDAVIRARVDVGAYDLVSEDGGHATESAARGDVLDFAVVWQADGWRLESVSRPTST
jgi:hypothetical protein